jgi:hypothetical protein
VSLRPFTRWGRGGSGGQYRRKAAAGVKRSCTFLDADPPGDRGKTDMVDRERRQGSRSSAKAIPRIMPADSHSMLEAASGFEPENGGFADLCLTTWLCRLKKWSGKRDLNPRLRPWQGRTLPLSYSRSMWGYFLTVNKFFVNQKKLTFRVVFGSG